ncbi:malonyl-ACP O-methyltransferase BioC [Acerihabitans sp. KWT182]|uniref:Malonyl-[acyl-carrier protein] O-methyltransferase n=1 Tax=Acerihabitans sp. KWT182 TaxID=3157919 RepID=A0AAU7QCU3_9GAMM
MMSADLHKQGIARTFGRAAAGYDSHAAFQRACGHELASLAGPLQGKTVLDAGCGTGYFSRFWRHAGNRVIALDLSPAMLEEARRRESASAYLAGDIERLPLADNGLDVCFSNLAVQWCDSLPRALAEFYRVIRPGGVIAFSTLAQGSLDELARAWRQVDAAVHVNPFLPAAAVARALQPYRHQLRAVPRRLYYSALTPLLRDIKGVGAGYLRGGRPLGLAGSQRLRRLETAWERHAAGLPLTYHLIYGLIYRD